MQKDQLTKGVERFSSKTNSQTKHVAVKQTW